MNEWNEANEETKHGPRLGYQTEAVYYTDHAHAFFRNTAYARL